MDTPFLIQKAFGKMVDMMDSLSHTMYFHNRRHTENVLITATEMALKSSMPHDDLIILQLAAIFHDTGHLYEYLGHEEKSKLIASSFLFAENVPAGVIESVTSAINATKMPQKPGNELEKIICDADLFHLAKPNYIDYANALRCEWEIYLNKKVSDQEWHQENLDFLTAHRYHSVYGHLVLEPLKEANINYLKKLAAYW